MAKMTNIPKRYSISDIPDGIVEVDSASPEYIFGKLKRSLQCDRATHRAGSLILQLPNGTVFIFDQ
jgi:hypothetical protein